MSGVRSTGQVAKTEPAKPAKPAKLTASELQILAHYHELNLMEVDLGKPRYHEVEEVGLVETGDLGTEVELVDDIPDARRETVDVCPEVVGNVVRIVEQLPEVEGGDVPQVLDLAEPVEDRPAMPAEASRQAPAEKTRSRAPSKRSKKKEDSE